MVLDFCMDISVVVQRAKAGEEDDETANVVKGPLNTQNTVLVRSPLRKQVGRDSEMCNVDGQRLVLSPWPLTTCSAS